jgi:hypothetical protein
MPPAEFLFAMAMILPTTISVIPMAEPLIQRLELATIRNYALVDTVLKPRKVYVMVHPAQQTLIANRARYRVSLLLGELWLV